MKLLELAEEFGQVVIYALEDDYGQPTGRYRVVAGDGLEDDLFADADVCLGEAVPSLLGQGGKS